MKLKKTITYLLSASMIAFCFYFPIKANAANQVISIKSIQKKTYYISYKVQKGDTLYSVAKKYRLATTQIQKDNRLKSTSLKTGQILKIKVTTYITVVNVPTINTLPVVTSLNTSTYVISGSIEANATISLSFKDTKNKTITYTAKADNKGKFYTKVNLSRLIDGKITLTAYQKNTKGVQSNNTVKSMFKDTIGPGVSFQSSIISSKNQSSFVIVGTSEVNSTISLTVSDKKHSDVKKAVKTDSKGKFATSIDVHSLNDGVLTISAIAKDKYGNTKTSSTTRIKDTVAPFITLNVANISSDNQLTYPLSGTADPNSVTKVMISDNKTTINSTINTDSIGKFFKNIDLHELSDGTITIDITSSDKAGNITEKKSNVTKSTFVNIPLPPVVKEPTPNPVETQKTYVLDTAQMEKWGIYNDGTHATETTKGLNTALKWAHDNGYNELHVLNGTYLISKGSSENDPSSYITMPGDMTLWLDDQATFQKETNSFIHYKVLVIPMFTENVTIKGGTYKGDKTTHNYYDGAVKWEVNKSYKTGDKVMSTNTVEDSSAYYYVATNDGVSGSKEPSWSNSTNTTDATVIWKPVARSTNEHGYGIITEGASIVSIEGIKSTNFTGDGLIISGNRAYWDDAYVGDFESGAIDDSGKMMSDSSKIRTKNYWNLTDPTFAKTHTFAIDQVKGTSQNFDVYFYKEDGTFLSKTGNQRWGYFISIPNEATKIKLVFTGSLSNSIYMEFQNKVQTSNIIVKDSEFSFNRRQGITVGGGDNVLIINNQIHDTKGTMPQSGIDVEGGFLEDGYLNTNISIKNNNLYNNAKYGVVLYDGNTALVEGNKLADRIGVHVSDPFTNATVKDNEFNNSNIWVYHDANFIGNTMKNGYVYAYGYNVNFDGMYMESTQLSMSPSKPYGITANNINLYYSSVSISNQPVRIDNATVTNLFVSSKSVLSGIIFNNLKMTGNIYGTFPAATYNNSSFDVKGALNITYGGTYAFNDSRFSGTSFSGLKINSPDANVSINNSTIDVALDSSSFLIEKANSVDLENNNIKSNAAIGTQKSVVMVGDDWSNANVSSILKTIIKGNTITSLVGTNGISTVFAGNNAPSFDIENNILYNGKLQLKQNDINLNNQLITK